MSTAFAEKIAALGMTQAHFQEICRFLQIKPATDSTLSQWNKGHRPANNHAIALLNALIMFPDFRDAVNRGIAARERAE